jgi:hypothetical protein
MTEPELEQRFDRGLFESSAALALATGEGSDAGYYYVIGMLAAAIDYIDRVRGTNQTVALLRELACDMEHDKTKPN